VRDPKYKNMGNTAKIVIAISILLSAASFSFLNYWHYQGILLDSEIKCERYGKEKTGFENETKVGFISEYEFGYSQKLNTCVILTSFKEIGQESRVVKRIYSFLNFYSETIYEYDSNCIDNKNACLTLSEFNQLVEDVMVF